MESQALIDLEPENLEENVSFIFDLPKGLRLEARMKALREGKSLSQVLRDFLQFWISE